MARAKKPKRCKTCHFSPCRCEDLAVGYTAAQIARGQWPRLSDSLGVHPSQIGEATAEAKRLGMRLEFTKDGSAVIESQAHQNEVARKLGKVDLSREITMPKGLVHKDRSVGRSR